MTMSADRYHFWTDYGGGLNGVCLWFCAKSLKNHLKKDSSVVADYVVYPPFNKKENGLEFGTEKPASWAFVKREQYADEREFRVVREGENVDTALDFPKSALKRIYISSWLGKCCVDRVKNEIRKRLSDCGGYGHVEIKQNRVRDYTKWQKALGNSSLQ